MFMLFSLLLSISQSFAYIPEYSTIVRRWSDANPKTPFGVEWAVTFIEGNKRYTAEETWWFKNENSADVSVVGTGNLTGLLDLSISYDNSKKRAEGQNGNMPNEMLEFFSVQKTPAVLRARLHQQGLTTADSLRDRPSIKPGQEDSYKAPSYIELTRSRGSISYWIKGNANAGVSIEQDKFVPRKFVFTSGATVGFDDYMKVGESFLFPKKKVFRWSQGEVELELKHFLTKKPADKTAASASKTTDVPLIQDFYRRFR